MQMSTLVSELETVIGQPIRKASLTDKAVLLKVTFHSYGTSRKVSSSQVDVGEADKSLIKTTKKILDSEEANAIRSLDGEIRQYVYKTCLPSSIWDGLHFCPLTSVERINAKLRDFSGQRACLVEMLADAYEQIVERDKARLGPLWIAKDYPPIATIRVEYRMDWQFIALTAPRSLESVSEELYMSAKQQIDQNVKEATEAIQEALREEFREFVSWLSTRLAPNPDGSPQRAVKAPALEKFKEFLDEFRNRNITDDAQLALLVERAKAVMQGVDARDLKDVGTLRDQVRNQFESIQSDLDSMMYTPTRKFMI